MEGIQRTSVSGVPVREIIQSFLILNNVEIFFLLMQKKNISWNWTEAKSWPENWDL